MTSYLLSIDTFSRSRTVFEIFYFKVLRVWPWTLTFRSHSRSKIFLLFEIPYMTSYLKVLLTLSLYPVPLLRYSDDLEDFEVWPWPWTFRCHLCAIVQICLNKKKSEVKNILTNRKLIHDFLSTSIDTLSILYRFRDIRFRIFGVWPWPLTFRCHVRWKIFSRFESLCMTS